MWLCSVRSVSVWKHNPAEHRSYSHPFQVLMRWCVLVVENEKSVVGSGVSGRSWLTSHLSFESMATADIQPAELSCKTQVSNRQEKFPGHNYSTIPPHNTHYAISNRSPVDSKPMQQQPRGKGPLPSSCPGAVCIPVNIHTGMDLSQQPSPLGKGPPQSLPWGR